MPINDKSLVIPGRGTFFTAPANTPLPEGGITAFKNIDGEAPAGWDNLGHTSSDDLLALKVDGGDATVLRTWLRQAVHTVYAATSWSIDGNSVQFDTATLKKIYSGWDTGDGGVSIGSAKRSQNLAIVVVTADTSGQAAFYIPNTAFSAGDAPSFDLEKFAKLPFHADFLSASSTALKADTDGTPALFAMYGPEVFAAKAAVAPKQQ